MATTYGGAAVGRPEPALVRAGLPVARGRVDGVGVDVALLGQGLVPHLGALRRGVHEGGARADLEPAVPGLVGDEAVVPPRLEHADHVFVVVGQTTGNQQPLEVNER